MGIVEIELEKVLELQQNKILEDSISSMTMIELQNNISQAQNDEAFAGATDAQKSILAKMANSRMSQMGGSKSVIGEERDEMSIIQMQVQAQRMEILKDAFSNPIETLLEYEPWTDQKLKEESDIEKTKPSPI